MNPNPLTDPRNRNYLIAGAGAAVAVIAFFLPFVTVSYIVSVSMSGADIASHGGGILWLCELLELAAVAIAALFIFRPANPLGSATTPVATQARWVAIGLTVAGGITFLILLINLLNAASE